MVVVVSQRDVQSKYTTYQDVAWFSAAGSNILVVHRKSILLELNRYAIDLPLSRSPTEPFTVE